MLPLSMPGTGRCPRRSSGWGTLDGGVRISAQSQPTPGASCVESTKGDIQAKGEIAEIGSSSLHARLCDLWHMLVRQDIALLAYVPPEENCTGRKAAIGTTTSSKQMMQLPFSARDLVGSWSREEFLTHRTFSSDATLAPELRIVDRQTGDQLSCDMLPVPDSRARDRVTTI